jgi:hypothetical protein
VLERVGRREQSLAALGRVEVGGELQDGGIVQGWIAMQVPAGGEDEQCASNGGIALLLGERDLAARDVRSDDEVDVCRQTVCSSATASASSRTAMPSSSSSRVIVSGGQTMTTFQCVIR